METIKNYLNNILIPTLQQYHVSPEHILYTTAVVEMQMESLIRIWNDRKLRNPVLLFGTEEGTFYEPKTSKLDTRKFIVVTLRNSPIETIQSDACTKAGLERPIPDIAIKRITLDAIHYFNKQDFEILSKEMQSKSNHDYYHEVLSNHPIAMKALSQLGSSSAKMIDYSPYETSIPYKLHELADFIAEENIDRFTTDTYDAYEKEFSQPLCNILKNYEQPGSDYFIVDSFKSLTRNFEKEIRIMEYLLSRGHAFVTVNYYIQNGHVEQRSKIIRSAHNINETRNNLSRLDGLGYQHKRALNLFLK